MNDPQKNFSSGREVLDAFVPNYESQLDLEPEVDVSQEDARLAADKLVKKFAKAIHRELSKQSS